MYWIHKHVKRMLATAALVIVLDAPAQVEDNHAAFMNVMHRAMSLMDHDMAVASMTGQADHDFAAMMLPHHRGAIEMAKAELLYGKDPVMRRLAQEILIGQQSEIEAMQLWMARASKASSRREP